MPASPDGLTIVAATTAKAGSDVDITVRGGAGGAPVEVWFNRRGDTTFSRRREARFAADGTFRTYYTAGDDYTFFAVSGSRTSPRATTRIDVLPPLLVPAPPTVVVTAPASVDAGDGVPISVTGKPGAAVDVWFRRRGNAVWSRLREGRLDASGRWSTHYVGVDDHEYWASSEGLSSRDVTTLTVPVVTGPRSAALGSRVELAGRARPGDSVVVESRRRGARDFTRTTLTADGSGVFGTSYAADDEYEYRALAASRTGALGRTTVAPTATGAVDAVRGKAVALTGTARPGTRVEVLVRRDGRPSLAVGGRRGTLLPRLHRRPGRHGRRRRALVDQHHADHHDPVVRPVRRQRQHGADHHSPLRRRVRRHPRGHARSNLPYRTRVTGDSGRRPVAAC